MGSTVNTMSEHDMHLLEPAPFGRILPAMVTPMKSDGSVDFAAAQKLAKYLVADGADGVGRVTCRFDSLYLFRLEDFQAGVQFCYFLCFF